jgi:hypothetical protein
MKSSSILSWSIIVIFMSIIGIMLTGATSLIISSEEQRLSTREDARDAALFKILGKQNEI